MCDARDFETYALLLRPDFWTQVEHRFGHALPPNLADALLARLGNGSQASKELRAMALALIEHLEQDRPGWGKWPDNLSDAMAVGMLLGVWIKIQAEKLAADLAEDELVFIEDSCRARAISLEEYLIENIHKTKGEGGEDEPADWWKTL